MFIFILFSFQYHFQFQQYKLKKPRWCAWHSQNGLLRQNQGAMAVARLIFFVSRKLINTRHQKIFVIVFRKFFLSGTPTLMAFTGVTNAHRPSPQPTACRSPLCSLTKKFIASSLKSVQRKISVLESRSLSRPSQRLVVVGDRSVGVDDVTV